MSGRKVSPGRPGKPWFHFMTGQSWNRKRMKEKNADKRTETFLCCLSHFLFSFSEISLPLVRILVSPLYDFAVIFFSLFPTTISWSGSRAVFLLISVIETSETFQLFPIKHSTHFLLSGRPSFLQYQEVCQLFSAAIFAGYTFFNLY